MGCLDNLPVRFDLLIRILLFVNIGIIMLSRCRSLKKRIPEDRLEVLMNNLSRYNRGELDYDSVVTRAEVILCTPEGGGTQESDANKDLFNLFCQFLSSDQQR